MKKLVLLCMSASLIKERERERETLLCQYRFIVVEDQYYKMNVSKEEPAS